MKRVVIWSVVLIALALLLAECLLRIFFGLGSPPLSIADSDIDYYFKPNQHIRRFGNSIFYNNVSMRCDFNVQAPYGGVRRVLVMGDSVINGGVLTSHEKLGTTILQRRHPDWQVYNVSAGSWGPGNCAAFLRKFGTFAVTDLIMEVNSHDVYEDDPVKSAGHTVGFDPDFPGNNPPCAIWEFFTRYVPRYLPRFGIKDEKKSKVDAPHWSDQSAECVSYNLAQLDQIFSVPCNRRILMIHRTKKESRMSEPSVGEKILRDWARRNGISVKLFNIPQSGYRDSIHLNDDGQALMAEFLDELLTSEE